MHALGYFTLSYYILFQVIFYVIQDHFILCHYKLFYPQV
jgi:hypothetical protein